MNVQATGLCLPGRLTATSLTLQAGEVTCLIGPNGSGKTSLLHAIAGIGEPAGKVSIDGVDPRTLPPPERMRLLSYLPASRETFWPLRAADLIALGCARPEDVPRIAALLAELGLDSFADRRVDRMSTGERSRVLIARALVSCPKLLLLDEPAANLDPLWQLKLMDYLRRTAEENGQALFVAMHDLELTRGYADRLIIMNERRIVADGAPDELLGSTQMHSVFGIEKRDGRWTPVG
jgi:iron complex transport system ATP-binding protein